MPPPPNVDLDHAIDGPTGHDLNVLFYDTMDRSSEGCAIVRVAFTTRSRYWSAVIGGAQSPTYSLVRKRPDRLMLIRRRCCSILTATRSSPRGSCHLIRIIAIFIRHHQRRYLFRDETRQIPPPGKVGEPPNLVAPFLPGPTKQINGRYLLRVMFHLPSQRIPTDCQMPYVMEELLGEFSGLRRFYPFRSPGLVHGWGGVIIAWAVS